MDHYGNSTAELKVAIFVGPIETDDALERNVHVSISSKDGVQDSGPRPEAVH